MPRSETFHSRGERPTSGDREAYSGQRNRTLWDRIAEPLLAASGGRTPSPPGQDRRGPSVSHRGKGPRGYRRADHRIIEDINELMMEDPWLDPTEIAVDAVDGRVQLVGIVAHARDRAYAEHLAWSVSGVRDVLNNIQVITQSGAANSLRGAV